MKRRKIIPYNPKLKGYARKLRNDSTFSEIILWGYLKGKQMRGYDFDRHKLNCRECSHTFPIVMALAV